MVNIDKLSIKEILEIPICKLKLNLSKSYLYPFIQQVYKELKSHNLLIKPIFWISYEWFSLNKTIGIGVPFYLLHPKLVQIEKQKIGFIEGSGKQCLPFLRHEVGHAIDNAYDLRMKKDKKRIKLFGKSSRPYKSYYKFNPYSKQYVINIGSHYAQSHPTEDFAETLAIWLNPRSNWKKRYKNIFIMQKLNYINNLMKQLSGLKPIYNGATKEDHISSINITVNKFYQKRLSNIKKFNKFKNQSGNKYIDFR